MRRLLLYYIYIASGMMEEPGAREAMIAWPLCVLPAGRAPPLVATQS